MIAPTSMDALAEAARALGFELRRFEGAIPRGIDFDRAQEQTQFGLWYGGELAFDGTSRECAAFLIGWRDLRVSVLGAVRAMDAQPLPEMSGRTRCEARDPHGRPCLLRAGHLERGQAHSALVSWPAVPEPEHCSVPGCGESGLCDACRSRGGR